MKYLRLALFVFASAVSVLRGQDDEERRAPPVEIPDFSNLDEYIYEPKSTARIGVRMLSGAKADFSGQSSIPSPRDAGPATGANIARYYHDGAVLQDLRQTPRRDSSGNPMIDPNSGAQILEPITPDGRTNNWAYADTRQIDPAFAPNGYIAFHSYSASVVDALVRGSKSGSTMGVDIAVSRDMGKLFGTRISWGLMAGVSVNDLSAKKTDHVTANLITITDLYSLYGQVPPEAPYTAPSYAYQPVLDASGNPVFNSDGSAQTVTVDNSVLIGNEPASRTTTTTTDSTSVFSSWKVKGAYYTFRAGPELWIPINERFRIGLSFGAAMIYAGSTYTLTQTFDPEFGPEVSQVDTSSIYKLRPGFFADASLQYDVTEKTGFFAGAVFQSAGNYTQRITTETADASTKIDFTNLNGVRAGMSIRF